MRTIIAGSRTIKDYDLLKKVIKDSGFNITTVISGNHWEGVDVLGEKWAKENNIPLELQPAKWKIYAYSAGPIRNREMAEVAEACIVLWDKKSKGSKSMILNAMQQKLKLYVYDIEVNTDTPLFQRRLVLILTMWWFPHWIN